MDVGGRGEQEQERKRRPESCADEVFMKRSCHACLHARSHLTTASDSVSCNVWHTNGLAVS